jgi:hypothetical protein
MTIGLLNEEKVFKNCSEGVLNNRSVLLDRNDSLLSLPFMISLFPHIIFFILHTELLCITFIAYYMNNTPCPPRRSLPKVQHFPWVVFKLPSKGNHGQEI